jgi:hypothetical protein
MPEPDVNNLLSLPCIARHVVASLSALWITAVVGCRPQARVAAVPTAMRDDGLAVIDLCDPSQPDVQAEPLRLRTPRGGWSEFALRVEPTDGAGRTVLRLPAFARGQVVSAKHAYQVLSVPVDFGTAAYVRQSGEPAQVRQTPRVLLPLPMSPDGTVDLSAARNPDRTPLLVWVEMRAATGAPAGEVNGNCELLDGPGGAASGSVSVTLSVADVTLPEERHLRITAPLDLSAASAARPAVYAGLTPRLLSRRDAACAAAVSDLDGLIRAAHDHRTDLFVGQLQPIVKWPPGRPPAIDWTDFDGVAGPWLDGSAFADRRPVGFWPLPSPDALDDFDLAAKSLYWGQAAAHFNRPGWSAGAHPVVLRPDVGGPPTEAAELILSAEARAVLASSPTAWAMLPLRQDQLRLASASNDALATAGTAHRLLTRADGDVQSADAADWPAGVDPPASYLDASNPGDPSPVLHGTGEEQDVRAAAWLAFLRGATVLTCGRPLPSTSPSSPIPADELPWLYPGSWYGVNGPLPTLQLKWLRQAEQDFEVLQMSADGGDRDAAMAVCRLICKPVKVGRAVAAAPTLPSEVSLLGGSTDPQGCAATRDLLIDRIVARKSGQAGGGVTQLDLRTVRWFNAHQRPTAFATGVDWMWATPPDLAGPALDPAMVGPGSWITARVNVDVYDPAVPAAPLDAGPADGAGPATWSGNTLQWRTAGGWEPRPPVSYVPVIPACGVRPVPALARFNLEQAPPAPPMTASGAAEPRPPVALTLVDGSDAQTVDCPLVLPVATSDRLTRPVTLDGALDDWFPSDAALLDRPLVRMSSRPAVQAGEARPADHPSSLYSGWTDDDLYVAFRVGGVTPEGARSARNFVEYREGRAWGEDLCEATVQPLYVDDTVGPTLHVVCKTGGEWVERQPAGGGEWQPFEGTALRYAATVDPTTGTWRGEVAIPWRAIVAAGRGRPSLLRFNFGQHVNATGESATWAGPLDRSRQPGMAGLLVLRDLRR